ncbi:MAG: hypothetical protein ACLFSC_10665 [Wenzhouxiangella sp.]
MSLFIGTPAYGGMVHCRFADQLLRYERKGIRFSFMSLANESLITRARNTILSEFHVRGEHDYLLFLDADVVLPESGLSRMLSFGVDVVGAAVPLKGRNPDGSRQFNVGRSLGEYGSLIQVTRIGTAALLLSRAAVQALVNQAIEEGRVYSRSRKNIRGDDVRASIHYDVFRTGIAGEEYLSEDFWVCKELMSLGYRIYVDPTIVTVHMGTVEV